MPGNKPCPPGCCCWKHNGRIMGTACAFIECKNIPAGGSGLGLCGSHYSQKRRGKVLTLVGSSRPRPLHPEEVPKHLWSIFNFEAQKIIQPSSSTPSMFIARTCITCNQQKEISVSQVRQTIKKGVITGKCLSCAPPRGADSYNWKGGKMVHGSGYIRIHSPDHPNADKKGYVFEHRLVMEKKLDRYLTRDENVHHINGIRDDNRSENLELWVGVGTQPAGIRAEDAPHCPTCACNIV